MNDALSDLKNALTRVVDGGTLSLDDATALELLVHESFRGTRLWDRLSGILAMYRPEGGEHLYHQQSLRDQFASVLLDWDALTGDTGAGPPGSKVALPS